MSTQLATAKMHSVPGLHEEEQRNEEANLHNPQGQKEPLHAHPSGCLGPGRPLGSCTAPWLGLGGAGSPAAACGKSPKKFRAGSRAFTHTQGSDRTYISHASYIHIYIYICICSLCVSIHPSASLRAEHTRLSHASGPATLKCISEKTSRFPLALRPKADCTNRPFQK